MAIHTVSLTFKSPIPLANKDIEIEVHEDRAVLGTIKISKGSLDWRPRGRSVNIHRLTWAKFAEIAERDGHKIRASVAKKA